jgi:hypothetical protein
MKVSAKTMAMALGFGLTAMWAVAQPRQSQDGVKPKLYNTVKQKLLENVYRTARYTSASAQTGALDGFEVRGWPREPKHVR